VLSDLDIETWHDASLRAGDEWQDQILRIAGTAKCMIVCWTEAAAQSAWVQRELAIGKTRGVLVPALFSNCAPAAGLESLHWADLSSWSGVLDHAGLRQLIDGIDRVLGRRLRARLEEQIGGRNPDVVAKLRTLLVSLARTHSTPISYASAHAHLCSLWNRGADTPLESLYGALDAIAEQNRVRREPPLFGLVVGAKGIPGRGYFQKHCFLAGGTGEEAAMVHAAHLKRVYGYSWPHDPPEAGDLLKLMQEE
jgi:hypothetical protein